MSRAMSSRGRMYPTLVLAGLALGIWAGAGRAAESYPGFCRERIARIEAAYSAGLERAGGAAERVECARLRYASLAGLVEIAYQSTLAWLAERASLLQAVQEDQNRWLAGRDRIIRNADDPEGMTAGDLDKAAGMMLERLRFFGCITAGTVFMEENWS